MYVCRKYYTHLYLALHEGTQFNFVSILVKIYEFLTASQFLGVLLYCFCPQNFERAATVKGNQKVSTIRAHNISFFI
jgi:hypothetical protein